LQVRTIETRERLGNAANFHRRNDEAPSKEGKKDEEGEDTQDVFTTFKARGAKINKSIVWRVKATRMFQR